MVILHDMMKLISTVVMRVINRGVMLMMLLMLLLLMVRLRPVAV